MAVPRKKKTEQEPVRLNKYIANAGLCSRREADTLIQEGKISVNGNVVTEMGTKVKPGDKVTYQGKSLRAEKPQYVLLNKPKDFITTVNDPKERKTVMSLVAKACPERIYPVGRLDRHTTGLLLFTNDGDLAKKLTHPSHNIRKIYQVELDRPLTKKDFDQIVEGITLEDGPVSVDELAAIGDDYRMLGIEIHSGRNRIIRRIFEHFKYKVVKLDRVMFGPLTKKNLPRGKWRHLSEKEVRLLKMIR
jgi:23S rRNA pseudouridine2605 synthase